MDQKFNTLLTISRSNNLHYIVRRTGYLTGYLMFFKNGVLHRVGSPALIYDDGREDWRREGGLHREDGPARITKVPNRRNPSREDTVKEWWVDNKRLSKKQFDARVHDQGKLW